MSITQWMLENDGLLNKYYEGSWSNPIDKETPTQTLAYTSFNDAGLECETGELLAAFVGILKPSKVLETGTHVGIGASYIGRALQLNEHGHLTTIEFLPELHHQAQNRILRLGLNDWVTCVYGDVRAYEFEDGYDLILLDTEPQFRFDEMVRVIDLLNDGGYLFIHDLHSHMGQLDSNPDHKEVKYWPWGILPGFIKQLVRNDALRPFHFRNPRGLTGFYKVAPNDYKWRENKYDRNI